MHHSQTLRPQVNSRPSGEHDYGAAGVSGRVTELCKVTQLKYSLSFAVLMGKNIDSIICDTERTAKDCIQYLKEQGVAPMTFIPIQSVRVAISLHPLTSHPTRLCPYNPLLPPQPHLQWV